MKKYILTAEVDHEGKLKICSDNDGFNALELLGLLHWKANDIYAQLKGAVSPDCVERVLRRKEQDDDR